VPAMTIPVRKKHLARTLQSIGAHPKPLAYLEQYTIPADLAAEILFYACYMYQDIERKFVLDMGTGTGRLAIGASMLGAQYVIGVDIDRPAIEVASESSRQFSLEIDWVLGDIRSLRGRVDTVLMNPPFGTKRPHADVDFLQAALDLSRVVYSIHKTSTRQFLQGWLHRHHAAGTVLMSTELEIKHQFSFHTKKKQYVAVDVFRIKPR